VLAALRYTLLMCRKAIHLPFHLETAEKMHGSELLYVMQLLFRFHVYSHHGYLGHLSILTYMKLHYVSILQAIMWIVVNMPTMKPIKVKNKWKLHGKKYHFSITPSVLIIIYRMTKVWQQYHGLLLTHIYESLISYIENYMVPRSYFVTYRVFHDLSYMPVAN
jgi:hypothetical protein